MLIGNGIFQNYVHVFASPISILYTRLKKVKSDFELTKVYVQIIDKIEEMLTESHDMTPKHAKQVLDHTWRDTPENMKIKLTADLPKLFSRLKSQGVKVSNFETLFYQRLNRNGSYT